MWVQPKTFWVWLSWELIKHSVFTRVKIKAVLMLISSVEVWALGCYEFFKNHRANSSVAECVVTCFVCLLWSDEHVLTLWTLSHRDVSDRIHYSYYYKTKLVRWKEIEELTWHREARARGRKQSSETRDKIMVNGFKEQQSEWREYICTWITLIHIKALNKHNKD